MLRFVGLVLLLAFSGPVFADETCKPEASKVHQGRQTWEQLFNQANVAHDGHLTINEARSAYPLAAKHFDDIDVDHKGYVTLNDMRAWQIMRKAARQLSRPQEDKLRPRSAVQHVYPDTPAKPMSGKRVMGSQT